MRKIKDKLMLGTIRAKDFISQKKGEGSFTDVVIVILIVAIVGSVLLGLLRVAMPELFEMVIDRIASGLRDVSFTGADGAPNP